MEKTDLEAQLKGLEADLEDLEETISFNLSHSSAHIGGAEVRRDQEILEEMRQEVARLRALLKELE